VIGRQLRAAQRRSKASGSRSGQGKGPRAERSESTAAGRSGSSANGRSGSAAAPDTHGEARKRAATRRPPPLEHRILVTATLCLLAFGAVMVYSASSGLSVLAAHGGGSGTSEFVRYLAFGALGLAAMQFLSKRGLSFLNSRMLTLMVLGSMALLLVVLLPGVGRMVNGARRWFAAGPIQFQPSELMKLSLVLYVARYLADNPKRLRGLRETIGPISLVAGRRAGMRSSWPPD
jgi:cell division protein FtsW